MESSFAKKQDRQNNRAVPPLFVVSHRRVDNIDENETSVNPVGFTVKIPVRRIAGQFTRAEDGTVDFVPNKKPVKEQPPEVVGYVSLSDEDKDLIHELARKVSPEEIAKQIGGNSRAVFRYMQERGLLSEDDKSDWRIKQAQLNELRSQAFYPALQQSYSTVELNYFEDEWVKIVSQ